MNKRERTKFDSIQMERMVAVGKVDSNSARIWMRSEKSGRVEITVRPGGIEPYHAVIDDKAADYTKSVLIEGLKPLTRYRYKVVRTSDRVELGSGQFETFPEKPEDTPGKFSIALMSCHQPFNDDGGISPVRMRLLKTLPLILKKHDVKFIMLAGDQIYSDHPERRSLFNPHYTAKWKIPDKESIFQWDGDTIRKAFQERYRICWSMKDVQRFYANYPCFPILDDHEIMDDWGTFPEHQSKTKYQKVFRHARESYFDYQGSLVRNRIRSLPPSFHYSFSYGNVGVFVLDLRSERKTDKKKGQLFGPQQLAEFKKFLRDNADKKAIIIMASVPVVHLPEFITNFGALILGSNVDFSDMWSARKNIRDRDKFLKALHSHQKANPKQRVVLVSGDVHIGCAFVIKWKGRGKRPVMYQFTSSGISNRPEKKGKKFLMKLSELGPKMLSGLFVRNGPEADVSLIKGASKGKGENPYGWENVGIIEVHKKGGESRVKLKLVGYSKDLKDYKEFFVSDLL
jgi:alkaline phosphatase D